MKLTKNNELFYNGINKFIVIKLDDIVRVKLKLYGKEYIESFPRYNNKKEDLTSYAIVITSAMCELNAYKEFLDACIEEGKTGAEVEDALINYCAAFEIYE